MFKKRAKRGNARPRTDINTTNTANAHVGGDGEAPKTILTRARTQRFTQPSRSGQPTKLSLAEIQDRYTLPDETEAIEATPEDTGIGEGGILRRALECGRVPLGDHEQQLASEMRRAHIKEALETESDEEWERLQLSRTAQLTGPGPWLRPKPLPTFESVVKAFDTKISELEEESLLISEAIASLETDIH